MPRSSRTHGSRSRGGSQAKQHPQRQQQMAQALTDTVRQHPVASAAAAGSAFAAGVYLWSHRNQIGEQMSNMGEQISHWSESMRGQSEATATGRGGRRLSEMGSETGEPMAGAGTTARSSTRATGGRSGKAQTGQTVNVSRTAAPTPGL